MDRTSSSNALVNSEVIAAVRGKTCEFDLVMTGSWEHYKCGGPTKGDNLCAFHNHMAQMDRNLTREIKERKYLPYFSPDWM